MMSECSFCCTPIPEKQLRMQCLVCRNYITCVDCFVAGVESRNHKADHQSFPLCRYEQSAAPGRLTLYEDLQLLHNVQNCGYGSFEEVRRRMNRPSNEPLEFLPRYYRAVFGENIIEVESTVNDPLTQFVTDTDLGRKILRTPIGLLSAPNIKKYPPAAEVVCPLATGEGDGSVYVEQTWPLREELAHEWCNKAEYSVMHMHIYFTEDKSTSQMKMAVLFAYASRLVQRQKFKEEFFRSSSHRIDHQVDRIVVALDKMALARLGPDYELLDWQQQLVDPNSITISMYDPMNEDVNRFESAHPELLRGFATRFEYRQYILSLLYEKQLRLQILRLQKAAILGKRKLSEIGPDCDQPLRTLSNKKTVRYFQRGVVSDAEAKINAVVPGEQPIEEKLQYLLDENFRRGGDGNKLARAGFPSPLDRRQAEQLILPQLKCKLCPGFCGSSCQQLCMTNYLSKEYEALKKLEIDKSSVIPCKCPTQNHLITCVHSRIPNATYQAVIDYTSDRKNRKGRSFIKDATHLVIPLMLQNSRVEEDQWLERLFSPTCCTATPLILSVIASMNFALSCQLLGQLTCDLQTDKSVGAVGDDAMLRTGPVMLGLILKQQFGYAKRLGDEDSIKLLYKIRQWSLALCKHAGLDARLQVNQFAQSAPNLQQLKGKLLSRPPAVVQPAQSVSYGQLLQQVGLHSAVLQQYSAKKAEPVTARVWLYEGLATFVMAARQPMSTLHQQVLNLAFLQNVTALKSQQFLYKKLNECLPAMRFALGRLDERRAQIQNTLLRDADHIVCRGGKVSETVLFGAGQPKFAVRIPPYDEALCYQNEDEPRHYTHRHPPEPEQVFKEKEKPKEHREPREPTRPRAARHGTATVPLVHLTRQQVFQAIRLLQLLTARALNEVETELMQQLLKTVTAPLKKNIKIDAPLSAHVRPTNAGISAISAAFCACFGVTLAEHQLAVEEYDSKGTATAYFVSLCGSAGAAEILHSIFVVQQYRTQDKGRHWSEPGRTDVMLLYCQYEYQAPWLVQGKQEEQEREEPVILQFGELVDIVPEPGDGIDEQQAKVIFENARSNFEPFRNIVLTELKTETVFVQTQKKAAQKQNDEIFVNFDENLQPASMMDQAIEVQKQKMIQYKAAARETGRPIPPVVIVQAPSQADRQAIASRQKRAQNENEHIEQEILKARQKMQKQSGNDVTSVKQQKTQPLELIAKQKLKQDLLAPPINSNIQAIKNEIFPQKMASIVQQTLAPAHVMANQDIFPSLIVQKDLIDTKQKNILDVKVAVMKAPEQTAQDQIILQSTNTAPVVIANAVSMDFFPAEMLILQHEQFQNTVSSQVVYDEKKLIQENFDLFPKDMNVNKVLEAPVVNNQVKQNELNKVSSDVFPMTKRSVGEPYLSNHIQVESSSEASKVVYAKTSYNEYIHEPPVVINPYDNLQQLYQQKSNKVQTHFNDPSIPPPSFKKSVTTQIQQSPAVELKNEMKPARQMQKPKAAPPMQMPRTTTQEEQTYPKTQAYRSEDLFPK